MVRFEDLIAADEGSGRAGVLPSQDLRMALEAGIITTVDGGPVPPQNVQPASLDLRLGPIAHRLRCSFLPGRQTVEERMKDLVMGDVDLTTGTAVLDKERPYLIPLKESLVLPPDLRGRANPKSSTGRADVFTRVITDRGQSFDDIEPGYTGRLYLEVVPLSFAVRVCEDLSLNQLRLSLGRTRLGDDDIRAAHARDPMLYRAGAAVPADELALSNGMFLGLDLRGDRGNHVGYRARQDAPLLDLTQIGRATVADYWEEVVRERESRITLTAHRFYLLMSYEAVRIPPTFAAEMTAYDPTSGELRTHYAGFFDPGFGFDPDHALVGSTAALEVRAHDVAFMVEDRQRVCKLTFEAMRAEPDSVYGRGISSSYQGQTNTLGKHFKIPRSSGGATRAAQGELQFTPAGGPAELPVDTPLVT